MFYITQKLIRDQEDEIFGVSTIDWDQTSWMKSTLIHEHVISCQCLGGKIAEYCIICTILENRIEWFTQSPTHRELNNIDGELVVFEWKIPRAHYAEATSGKSKT